MIINIIVNFYGFLYNRRGIPIVVFSPFRFLFRKIANVFLPILLKNAGPSRQPLKKNVKKIIVSLTSFPGRIDSVWLVIVCMLRQSMAPDLIILWLSKQQFEDFSALPVSLKKILSERFQIRLVDGDYRSHKKYLYAFQEFSNDIVITIDDDIFYPTNMIKELYKAHLVNPKAIICRYGKSIKHKDGSLAPYRTWKEYYSLDEKNIFFGSGGGTLFVPSVLHSDALDISKAFDLCPLADDIWLNAMARLNAVEIIPITRCLILPIIIQNEETLCSVNVDQNMNDKQLSAVNTAYFKTYGRNIF